MQKLLLVALASAFASSSAAQTDRIAYASHSGNATTLLNEEKGVDNFGIPYAYSHNNHSAEEWKKDSFVSINDSLVEHRGLVRMYNNSTETYGPWKHRVDVYIGRGNEVVKYNFPKAVLAKPPQKKPRSKPAGNSSALPVRPFQYSLWRGLGGVVGLGALGWLLGRPRPA
jgi:hypothetical protein